MVPDRAEVVERLYARHRDQVFRLALRYGAGDADWAEDVTHDVFVRLLRAVDRLRDEDDLGGWFYRVTTNRCLSHLQRDRVRRSLLSMIPFRGTAPSDPEREMAAKSDLDRTLAVVRSLPPKERVAFSMLHLDGKSQKEIAAIMGHSKGYVSKLIRRATDRVRAAGWEVAS